MAIDCYGGATSIDPSLLVIRICKGGMKPHKLLLDAGVQYPRSHSSTLMLLNDSKKTFSTDSATMRKGSLLAQGNKIVKSRSQVFKELYFRF
jgi:hypothetical protein